MRCADERHSVATGERRVERPIIDVRADVFLRLTSGERQLLSAPLGDHLVEVITQFFVSDDETRGVGDVRITRHGALKLQVIRDRRAFVLHGEQTETGDFDLFLVSLVRRLDIEEIGVFFSVFVVGTTPPACVQIGALDQSRRPKRPLHVAMQA